METVLTAEQAKAARDALHLSQGKVASEVGINRTYLSLFEGGKYVFDDNTLSALRSYYEQQDYDFDSDTDGADMKARISKPRPSSARAVRVKDGFVVPGLMAEEDVEPLLAEYQTNRQKIMQLCGEAPESGFFSAVDSDDLEKRLQIVLGLMARNYTLIEQLHGHIPFGSSLENGEGERKKTVGGYLAERFEAHFGAGDKTGEQQKAEEKAELL